MSGASKASRATWALLAAFSLSLILNGFLIFLVIDNSVAVTYCNDFQRTAWAHQDKLDKALKDCGATRECMGPLDDKMSVTFGPDGKYLGSSDGSHETPGYVKE
ncbi:MAG: hypothetical protein H6718_00225 [Polyangiaceae bacterium]|nr:hypothetical protein [Myxococcales bacterium]MCB9583787.1 hypothetical protein [Polyangiaceae bacterium]